MEDFNFLHKKKRFTCCFKLAKSLPVLLVCSLIGYSYYCYIIQLCLGTLENFGSSLPQQIFYILIYHVLLILLLWSYWQTVFTCTGAVPKRFKLSDEIIEQFKSATSEEGKLQAIEKYGNDLPIVTRTYIGGRATYRFCFVCNHLKPDRCHHCRICGVCVLKMDHHCPWVNNCISYTNYKYFVLFLFYAFMFCSYIVITTLPYFLLIWKHSASPSGGIHILFLFIIAAMFFLSIMSIFTYHLYLIGCNRTTLEAFRAPVFENGRVDKNGFNLGLVNNFKQIFGNRYALWPFPIFTSLGNGITFERARQHADRKTLLDENENNSEDDAEIRDVFFV
ncbi:palmitoyltransferase ZDHHC15 isoform X3 [Planococcus citri]|uniref:palmitoyltransferase ZDHHC15 isoform X3 n=1 Tax=Planococcus citri TaxID=170843 RepID=UPI0031F974AF